MSQISFNQFQAEFFRLYEAGEHDKALAWIKLLGGLFPERAGATYNWRMCLAALAGRPDEAISIFQEALDLGLWWPEALLREDADLASLQDRVDFNQMVARSRQLQAEAQASSKPELLLYLPDEAAPRPCPLLLAFHGRAGSARETIEYWRELSDRGWIVAAAQSSILMGAGTYGWEDPALAGQEALALLTDLRGQHPVDPRRIVLGGFSQGAGLAIRLSLTQAIPAQAFIAVGPSLPQAGELAGAAAAGRAAGVRGYLVCGGQDRLRLGFPPIEVLLRRAGVAYSREDHPDLGHEYPPQFSETLKRSLDFFNFSG